MDELFETYNNKIQDLYEKMISCLDEGHSVEEYIFKKIPKIPSVKEYYNKEQFEIISKKIPKTTLLKAEGLVRKINNFLKEKNENLYFLDSLVSDLYSTLNRKSIK